MIIITDQRFQLSVGAEVDMYKVGTGRRYEGGKWAGCLGINEIMFVVEGVRRRSGERCQSRNGKVQMMTTGWKREKKSALGQGWILGSWVFLESCN